LGTSDDRDHRQT
jgi:hypothetical protein